MPIMKSTPETTITASDSDSIGSAIFYNDEGRPVSAEEPTALDIRSIERFQDLEDPAAVLDDGLDTAA